ncbi:DNA helicase [Flexivirga endophytica]|uniref:DNA helicase n=1 Tax=Flexivirga endophytica TaxID=1849103 RepID=A0A916TG67_9MICO|nr:AAA family ATPase [Flexivirga endophytica]GGB44084.1 DNA helicase [Flexivirga endophytica]GHB59961.1 DNA helicase [Flexivirga endophytica]
MPDHSPVTTDLEPERAYLAAARADLTRMRERAESLDPNRASDGDSAYELAVTLARRVASLQDNPHTTLFFGRIDHADPPPRYIGRRHVSNDAGDPVVLDWRAPVSTAFYRASRTEPMGVVRRRRFGIDKGQISAIEDENLLAADESDSSSAILAQEIERPRTGPMRDIVATIQPEQDLIVRSDVDVSVCVQGAPGTGKTAVGLHRAAWLLYTHRDRLDRSGVLVVGPNRAFLDHISAVLPALGEVRVGHSTAADLVAHARVRSVDSTEAAVLKGDSRMAEVLRRALWSRVGRPTEPLVLPRGARKWRIPAYEVQEIVDELMTRGVRFNAAREMLPRRLAHAVLLRMERAGDSPDDRVQESVARSGPVKKYSATVWPAVDPAQVLFDLWSDSERLAAAADGVLDADEQRILLWGKPARSKGTAKWSVADVTLLDELHDLLSRTPSLGHVVLDEAQDLSPMQLRAVGRRCSTGAITVLGDIAQGTTPWATDSWGTAMTHLGKPEHHLEVLDRGFRVPAAVIDFAARLLPSMAPGLGAPVSVRDNTGELRLVTVGEDERSAALIEAVRSALADPGSVGLIVPDADVTATAKALRENGIEHGQLGVESVDEADHRVQLVPATVAKGLEFDHVVVLEPSDIADAEPDTRTGLRRLYVVLTRAVSSLRVIHSRPLPAELAEHA